MLPTLLILLVTLAGLLIYHFRAPSLKLKLAQVEALAKEAEKDLLTALRNRLKVIEAYLKVKE